MTNESQGDPAQRAFNTDAIWVMDLTGEGWRGKAHMTMNKQGYVHVVLRIASIEYAVGAAAANMLFDVLAAGRERFIRGETETKAMPELEGPAQYGTLMRFSFTEHPGEEIEGAVHETGTEAARFAAAEEVFH